MAIVRIYAAVSLDGFVADNGGDTSWMQPFEAAIFQDSGFLDSIGAVVLGRRAFEFLTAFGDWPYPNKQGFVVSATAEGKVPDGCKYVRGGIVAAVDAAKAAAGDKDVWIVGGAMTLQSAIRDAVVDSLEMCLVPVMLGQGMALMEPLDGPLKASFDGITTYPQDIIKLRYMMTT